MFSDMETYTLKILYFFILLSSELAVMCLVWLFLDYSGIIFVCVYISCMFSIEKNYCIEIIHIVRLITQTESTWF